MRILMLGWEYPPKISGGLGIACQGLAKGLSELGHKVTFVLPKIFDPPRDKKISFVDASGIQLDPSEFLKEYTTTEVISELGISSMLVPYLPPQYFRNVTEKHRKSTEIRPDESIQLLNKIPLTGSYSHSILSELKKYALVVFKLSGEKKFDVVHAHDWLTFPAASSVKKQQNIPYIAHFHSTEIDRNGSYASREIIEIEKEGIRYADKILAVSNALKERLIGDYQADADKITVIPNGHNSKSIKRPQTRHRTVGFIGRFADQKAPGRFIDIARELLGRNPDLRFSMVGDGYLMESIQNKISQINLSKFIEIKGFIEHKNVAKWLSKTDLVIVPSVAEPFGLVALEAIDCGTPVIISKGAGVCEFIPDIIQVDNWDVFNFGVQADRLLTDDAFREANIESCRNAIASLSWLNAAKLTDNLYHRQK